MDKINIDFELDDIVKLRCLCKDYIKTHDNIENDQKSQKYIEDIKDIENKLKISLNKLYGSKSYEAFDEKSDIKIWVDYNNDNMPNGYLYCNTITELKRKILELEEKGDINFGDNSIIIDINFDVVSSINDVINWIKKTDRLHVKINYHADNIDKFHKCEYCNHFINIKKYNPVNNLKWYNCGKLRMEMNIYKCPACGKYVSQFIYR